VAPEQTPIACIVIDGMWLLVVNSSMMNEENYAGDKNYDR
jgi:hypothetical protein